MVQAIYINEDNLVRIDKARIASDNSYINAGSGSWMLKAKDSAEVAGGALTRIAGSNGRWEGTIDKTITAALTEGGTYFLELTLTDGAGADSFRRIELEARYHGED